MTLKLVDTHCHIQAIDGGEDNTTARWRELGLSIDQVIERAHLANVERLICVGCAYQDSVAAVNCAEGFSNIYAAIGIHPHEAKLHMSQDWDKFKALAKNKRVVAVGECGLDYFYAHSPKEDQVAVLLKQLEIASAADLPLIFHVREAYDDFWPLLDRFSGLKGVLHSFTDSAANLKEALNRGLYIGVNGISTFSRDSAQLAMFESIPLDRLLLETDAPYLTPTPYRGSINEPKHILTIAEFWAGKRNIELAELAHITTQNANNLFKF